MVNEFAEQNKAAVSRMKAKGKLRYFVDYYLLKVVIAAAVAGFAGLFLYSLLAPKKSYALNVAVFDAQLDEKQEENLAETLAKELGCDPEEIHFDDKFLSTSAEDLQDFNVLCANHAVDALVAPRKVFDEYAGNGYFEDLASMKVTIPASRSLRVPGLLETTDEDGLGEDVSGGGEKKLYGASLSESRAWNKVQSQVDDPAIGIVLGTKHRTAVKTLLSELVK